MKEIKLVFTPKVGDVIIQSPDSLLKKTREDSEPYPTYYEVVSLWEDGQKLYGTIKQSWSDGKITFEEVMFLVEQSQQVVKRQAGVFVKIWKWIKNLFQ